MSLSLSKLLKNWIFRIFRSDFSNFRLFSGISTNTESLVSSPWKNIYFHFLKKSFLVKSIQKNIILFYIPKHWQQPECWNPRIAAPRGINHKPNQECVIKWDAKPGCKERRDINRPLTGWAHRLKRCEWTTSLMRRHPNLDTSAEASFAVTECHATCWVRWTQQHLGSAFR